MTSSPFLCRSVTESRAHPRPDHGLEGETVLNHWILPCDWRWQVEVVANVTPKAGETITQAELDSLGGVVASRCPVEALFTAANIPVEATWRLQTEEE